jgi:RimJ/RimL family protein N-acetyltransferase
MIKYKLNYEDLIERNIHLDFKIVETADGDVIKRCIDLFNSKITWDNMFDLNEANKRINNGEKLFVGYYENNLVGYCWLKSLNEFEYYIYNVFIGIDITNRNYGATDLLYLLIKNHTSGVIVADIDEWNVKSQKVFEKLGFNPTN